MCALQFRRISAIVQVFNALPSISEDIPVTLSKKCKYILILSLSSLFKCTMDQLPGHIYFHVIYDSANRPKNKQI